MYFTGKPNISHSVEFESKMVEKLSTRNAAVDKVNNFDGMEEVNFAYTKYHWYGHYAHIYSIIWHIFSHFPEPPWLIPFLALAISIAIHLGLSLQDYIKEKFCQSKKDYPFEMGCNKGARTGGKWNITSSLSFIRIRSIYIFGRWGATFPTAEKCSPEAEAVQ